MGNWKLLALGLVVIVAGMLIKGSAFTVRETEQVMVVQFGEIKAIYQEPGLHFKVPFIQDVQVYEKRVLNLDPPVASMLLADQKRILVDAFARYRISDPKLFFQRVKDEQTAKERLGVILNSALREELGKTTLASVLSEERISLLATIAANVNQQAKDFGVETLDVRIRRADLPEQVSVQVYERMKAEREREAAEFRAQGFERAQRIKAGADREATVIIAEAKRESEILQGQGEGERTRILNEAFGQDTDFFKFYRSMQAYENSLGGDSTYMVLSPSSEFFRFFKQAQSSPPVQSVE